MWLHENFYIKLLFAQNGGPNYVSYQRAITPVKIVAYNFPYYTVFINRQIQPRLKKILNKNIVFIVNLKVFFKSKRSREFEFSSNVAKLFQLQCQSQNCLKLHMVERAYSNLKKNEAICMTNNYLNKNNISMRNFSIIWYLCPVLIWSGASVRGTTHCPMPIQDHPYHKSKEETGIRKVQYVLI